MTGERVVADFVGRFTRNPSNTAFEELTEGRIMMSRTRLVIAEGDDRITIPLSRVVDLVVGNAPAHLKELFDNTVTVGYKSDEGRIETILIEGTEETVSKFENVAFKSLLTGAKVSIKHPARLGGRVTETPVQNANLSIGTRQVIFKTSQKSIHLDITDVIGFGRSKRTLSGMSKPTLLVKHAERTRTATSIIMPHSTRILNILGRFLRIRYGELLEQADEIDLSEPQKRLLVSMYASEDDIDFAAVLNGDAARATNVLNSLGRKGLIRDDESGTSLTPIGQVIVNQRLEDVNV